MDPTRFLKRSGRGNVGRSFHGDGQGVRGVVRERPPGLHATGTADFAWGVMMPIMATEDVVVGIELSPIFVVARESEAIAVTEQDFVPGVSVRELMNELQPDQHIYLVDLHNPGQEFGVKLIRLT